jgi:hypothetical protein
MALNRYLVDSIIEEVRLICGESNVGGVDDELVLRLLNSAQEEAAQLLSRNYPEPLLTYIDIPLTSTQDYDIPENCFEGRVLKCEVISSSLSGAYPMQRRDYNDDIISAYSSSSTSAIPEAWIQIGTTNSVRVFPTPMAGATLRMWYCRKPDDLVVSQGRIKSLPTNYIAASGVPIELDVIGDAVTSNQNEDGSHLSIIDGQTGTRKAILEVISVDTTNSVIKFNLTPLTAVIEGEAVSAPSFTAQKIAVGDYVCLAPYTCLPSIRAPLIRYIVQYATAMVQTQLGADHAVQFQMLQKLQKFVESMDSGKQTHRRVKLKSDAFGSTTGNRFSYPRPQP